MRMGLVVYEHNCSNISKYHLGKYKHWAKLITDVDTTKTNGFAFQGEWLSTTNQVKVPENSIIVEYRSCEGKEFHLYKMTKQGKEEIAAAERGKLVDFIDTAAVLVEEEVEKKLGYKVHHDATELEYTPW